MKFGSPPPPPPPAAAHDRRRWCRAPRPTVLQRALQLAPTTAQRWARTVARPTTQRRAPPPFQRKSTTGAAARGLPGTGKKNISLPQVFAWWAIIARTSTTGAEAPELSTVPPQRWCLAAALAVGSSTTPSFYTLVLPPWCTYRTARTDTRGPALHDQVAAEIARAHNAQATNGTISAM